MNILATGGCGFLGEYLRENPQAVKLPTKD